MSPIRSTRLIRTLIALCGLIALAVLMSTNRANAMQVGLDDKPPTDAPPAEEPEDNPAFERPGAHAIAFTERSPLSNIASMRSRIRFTTPDDTPDYDLSKEVFDLYVPYKFDPNKTYGLIVWVSPTDSGGLPPGYQPICDEHDLLCIGARKAGNDRLGWHRFGLALDAAFNMQQRYRIDPDRVYISGMSGGGRVSSRMGVAYADVFSGAFMIVGCDFYKRTPVPNDPAKVYIERYAMPIGKILAKAVRDNRYVLLTGTNDFNRDETQSIFENGFQKERFAHVTYLEVPGMGHELPPRDWFEKGIDALDTPLFEARAQAAENAASAEQDAANALAKAREVFANDPVAGYVQLLSVAEHFEGTKAAADARQQAEAFAADPANKRSIDAAKNREQAEQLLAMIDNYIAAGRPDLAREKLKQVIDLVPNTDLAKQAAKRLKDLEK